MQAGGADKAALDKATAESTQAMAKGKEWLGKFTAAGGKRMYIVGDFKSIQTGNPPVMIIPIEGGGDGSALVKLIEENNKGEDAEKPTATVVGQNVIVGTKAAVDAARAAGGAGGALRPQFAQALAAGGNAPIRFAINGSAIVKANPALAAQPAANNVEWIALSVNLPPTEALSLTVQAKTADAAQQFAALTNMMLGVMSGNPDVKQAIGDPAPLVRRHPPGER